MSEINILLSAYEDVLSLPWEDYLAGQEKVWFVVYSPRNERRLRLHFQEFELKTLDSGYDWLEVDITNTFPEWMASLDYREAFFENPQDLDPKLEEYTDYVRTIIIDSLNRGDEDTVVAVYGLSTLFGLTHASKVLEGVTNDIRGRLLVFFPGRYDGSVYRLLDARDGWNYLAVPITAN